MPDRRSFSPSPIAGVIGVVLLLQGCMTTTILGYEPLTRELDGMSELHISTYPAGFPKDTFGVPFIYKGRQTPKAVFFQVFIRDAEKKVGQNSHIDSIQIHSFSYQIDNEASVQLISDFDANFWMQGQQKYNPEEHAPVLYYQGGSVQVSMDLTVNGRDYSINEHMQAVEHQSVAPLFFHALQ